jgi:hypothetical protein
MNRALLDRALGGLIEKVGGWLESPWRLIRWLALFVLVVWAMFGIAPIVICNALGLSSELSAGTIGDMFGAANALFSGLAFVGLVVTVAMQGKSIRDFHDSERKKRQPFLIIEPSEGPFLRQARTAHGATHIPLSLLFKLKNSSDEVAMNVNVSCRIEALPDCNATVALETPIGANEPASGIELTIKVPGTAVFAEIGTEDADTGKMSKAQPWRLDIAIEYMNLQRTTIRSAVAFSLFLPADTRPQHLQALRTWLHSSSDKAASFADHRSSIRLEREVVKDSWDYRLL